MKKLSNKRFVANEPANVLDPEFLKQTDIHAFEVLEQQMRNLMQDILYVMFLTNPEAG